MRKLIVIIVNLIILVGVFFSALFLIDYTQKKYVYPLEYEDLVLEYSKEYDLSPYLVCAVINVESSFDKNAVSNKGAKGLMQLMDSTAEFVSKKAKLTEYDIFNEKDNINLGCYYLRYLLNKFDDEKLALIAYNAGEGTTREWLLNKEYSKDGKTLNKIPYKETENYIEKIYKNQSKYYKLYDKLLDKQKKFE